MQALPTCSSYTLFRFEIDRIAGYLDILTEHLLNNQQYIWKKDLSEGC